jgi:hypothetical protein
MNILNTRFVIKIYSQNVTIIWIGNNTFKVQIVDILLGSVSFQIGNVYIRWFSKTNIKLSLVQQIGIQINKILMIKVTS